MHTYQVTRVLGADNNTHHNNKWSVRRCRNGAGKGTEVFVAAGDKARERAEYVRDMFSRVRSPEEECFFQRLLADNRAADNELRTIVGANPRANP